MKKKNIENTKTLISDKTEHDDYNKYESDLLNIDYIIASPYNGRYSINIDKNKKVPTHVLLNVESSGIADAKDYEKALECLSYKEDKPMISRYWNSLQYNTDTANSCMNKMYFGTEIKMIVLDLFYTLKNQLVYEFDWVEDELIKELKLQSVNILEQINDSSYRIPIDEMYYYYQTMIKSAGEDKPEKHEVHFQDAFLVVSPFAEVLSTEITAIVVDSIYNAFFNILFAKANSSDFDTICKYVKPYIMEFKDNLVESLVGILIELMINRSRVDIDRYDFIKKLSEEFGNPFLY